LFHRLDNIRGKNDECPICGRQMVPCEYIALSNKGVPEIGYIEGEVLHWSPNNPGDGYGWSPMITCWSELMTITNIIRLASVEYQQYRPPKGYLFFRTRNIESLTAQFQAAEEELKHNPIAIPKIAIEPDGLSGGETGKVRGMDTADTRTGKSCRRFRS